MDGSGHAVIVSGAEIAGNGHACAHGQTGKEADEQEDQRARRTDGRQRLIPQKPADNQRVRRIVKLLEHLTEKNRYGKLNNQLPCASLRHIQRISAHSASIPSRKKYRVHSAIYNSIPEIKRKCKPVSSAGSGGSSRRAPSGINALRSKFAEQCEFAGFPKPPLAAPRAVRGAGICAANDGGDGVQISECFLNLRRSNPLSQLR